MIYNAKDLFLGVGRELLSVVIPSSAEMASPSPVA
jgi:hypothetical protein